MSIIANPYVIPGSGPLDRTGGGRQVASIKTPVTVSRDAATIQDRLTVNPNRLSTSDPPAAAATDTPPASGGKTFSFRDFIDIINPLQHIPVVGTIYRAVTGDEIAPPSRVLGGGIFGGLIGGLSGLANAIFAEATGRDIGGHLLALFKIGEPEQAVAAADEPIGGDPGTVESPSELTYAFPSTGPLANHRQEGADPAAAAVPWPTLKNTDMMAERLRVLG